MGGKIMAKGGIKTEHYRIHLKHSSKGGGKMLRIGRFIIIILFAACLGVLLIRAPASAGVKLRAMIAADPINLDPAHVSRTQDRDLTQQFFQGLVTFDITRKPPFPILPVLAESYEVAKDARMITFKLRKGIQFHHGYGELTSEDIVFSLVRHQDPKVASRGKAQMVDVERVEAPDKYTVKIYLKRPSALTLLQCLAWQTIGHVISKKAALKLGDKIARMPVGTGPYYFDRWDPGEKVVLKKFDRYWRTPAKIDEIEFWIMPEEVVALGALEKGDLDIALVSMLGAYGRAKDIKNVYLAEAHGAVWQNIYYINQKMKPMDDLRVRQALAHALDVKGIAARIGPLVLPFPSPFPPALLGATDEFWTYEYDVGKAKQLLAEAGYPNGFELRILYSASGLYEPVLLEVKNCWDKIVDVKIQAVEKAILNKTMRKWKHHLVARGFTRYIPYLYAQLYMTGSPLNNSHYSNPKVDQVIEKARTAKTEEEAIKYWRELQRMVTEDVVNLWVVHGKSVAAIRNRVKGVAVAPYIGVLDLERAYIVE
jgi:peptide/nickel transport system substrate-binding protein